MIPSDEAGFRVTPFKDLPQQVFPNVSRGRVSRPEKSPRGHETYTATRLCTFDGPAKQISGGAHDFLLSLWAIQILLRMISYGFSPQRQGSD